MDDKPKLYVINGITGEHRAYEAEDEQDLDQSIESIDSHFDWLARARKNLNKARHLEHIRVMQAKTVDYLDTEGYQASYGSVFLLMIGKAKYGGRVPLTREQIQEKFGYSRQTVSRAIAHLKKNGMIVEGEHEGRMYYYLPTAAAEKGYHELKTTKHRVSAIKRAQAKWDAARNTITSPSNSERP